MQFKILLFLFLSQKDFEHLGRAYCETLMDYYDENPLKVNAIHRQIKKIRKRERKLRKAAKAKKLAEEECIRMLNSRKNEQLDCSSSD